MRRVSALWTWTSTLALLGIGCAGEPTGSSAQTITVATEVNATFTSPSCVIGSGPSVALTGELELGGLGARLIFRNNQKGTHELSDDLTATTVLIPSGETLEIPTTAIQDPSNGAPVIYVQFLDGAGNAVSGEILLGACEAAGFPASATVALATTVTLSVSAAGCSNNPGPTITVEGAVEFAGVADHQGGQHQAQGGQMIDLIVRSADGSTVGEIVASADVVALQPGETHTIPKQPSSGGVGGNPWIWAELLDAAGAPLSDEIFIGRCVDIGSTTPSES